MDHTTDTGLEAALGIYRGDWDEEGTVSVHLPSRIARKALTARGWRVLSWGDVPDQLPQQATRVPPGAFHSVLAPNGDRFWDLQEALQLAITAEVEDAP